MVFGKIIEEERKFNNNSEYVYVIKALLMIHTKKCPLHII